MALRVLVFDDDKATCDLLDKALTAKGYEVTSYSTPFQFPFLHRESCPCPPEEPCADVILADIVMPEIDGIAFLKKLMVSGCLPVKLGNMAIMSGYLTLTYMSEMNEIGIPYFRKPFRLETIYAWLEECKIRCNK